MTPREQLQKFADEAVSLFSKDTSQIGTTDALAALHLFQTSRDEYARQQNPSPSLAVSWSGSHD
jgi:hypothetical protein